VHFAVSVQVVVDHFVVGVQFPAGFVTVSLQVVVDVIVFVFVVPWPGAVVVL
jgi:hypothetical protein